METSPEIPAIRHLASGLAKILEIHLVDFVGHIDEMLHRTEHLELCTAEELTILMAFQNELESAIRAHGWTL